jgi:hypothetical protein
MSRRVSCVTRTLDAIRRYKPAPDQIDIVILAAINVGLCLESNCDRLVAEGFNHDIVANGRDFGRSTGGATTYEALRKIGGGGRGPDA